MSGKLDQSLDAIIRDERKSGKGKRGGRAGRRGGGRAGATAAPVGGVKKTPQNAKGARAASTAPAGGSASNQFVISNLPVDVDEKSLKGYLTQWSVKKVTLQYGETGRSRGIATVIFNNAENARKAASEIDGIKIDNRPMRVQWLVSPQDIPAAPPAKSLADRVTQPKSAKAQPKPATAVKSTATRGRGRGGKRGARGGRTNRPPVTHDQLDDEMTDYFAANVTNNAQDGGEVQAPNGGGDVGMEDEML